MGSIIADYIEKINQCIKKMKKTNEEIIGGNTESLLFAFRGEPRDYGETKLTPSIFRNESYVNKEEHLFELLADYGVIEGNNNRNIEKMIDAQHFVAISRALDISFNSLVALFFACSSDDAKDMDGYLYTFCFPNYISPHSEEIEALYNSIISGEDKYIIDKNFKVITHTKNNERIIAQYGGFIFFPGRSRCKIKDIYYESVLIKKEDKEQILFELENLFGINKAKLFPEKSSISELVKKMYQSDNYIRSKESPVFNQIDEYFHRLDYELEAYKKVGYSEMEIKRLLRKEVDDMNTYSNQLDIDNKELEEVIKRIETKFYELKVSKL